MQVDAYACSEDALIVNFCELWFLLQIRYFELLIVNWDLNPMPPSSQPDSSKENVAMPTPISKPMATPGTQDLQVRSRKEDVDPCLLHLHLSQTHHFLMLATPLGVNHRQCTVFVRHDMTWNVKSKT